MNAMLRHLVVLPIVVPLITGAALFFLAEASRVARVTLVVGSAARPVRRSRKRCCI